MDKISVVVLAGGMGSRIGGAKPLQQLQGRPLLDWVLEAIRPQCDEILISANNNLETYARYDCAVIADRIQGYAGPLAGLQSALQFARHPLVASVPCDTPFLPHDLIERLHSSLISGNNEMSVAVTEGRRQAAIALYNKYLLKKLNGYLESGGRKVISWQDALRSGIAEFEDAAAFANINTTEDLSLANQILQAGGSCVESSEPSLKIGLVSISDRASRGEYRDEGLPALHEWFTQALKSQWQSVTRLIPDEQALIEETLINLADHEGCHLILTTGGTGPAPRDVTPEATLAVAHKVLPGFGEQMRAVSLRYVPTAILSRQAGVVRGSTLILNLPGQPKAIKETLDGVFSAVPYCIDLIGGPYIETRQEVIMAFRPKSAVRPL